MISPFFILFLLKKGDMSSIEIIVITIIAFGLFIGLLINIYYSDKTKIEYIEVESKVRTFRVKDGFRKIYLIEESDNKYIVIDGNYIIKDLSMDKVKLNYKI